MTRLAFKTSSYSCVNSCVEVALDGRVAVVVRDSKNREAATLRFDAAAWKSFVGGVSTGLFGSSGA